MLARQYMEVQAIIAPLARAATTRTCSSSCCTCRSCAPPSCDDAARLDATGAQQLETRSTPTTAAGRTLSRRRCEAGRRRRTSSSRAPSTASPTEKHLHREFFNSASTAASPSSARTLAGLIGEGAYVQRGEAAPATSASFKEAIAWLLDQARKGQTIQRYKGLGEMNPEQLWDTTINPETRRLLQVRIEDALAADEIFIDADGRPGRAAPRVHRAQRAVGVQPRRVNHER